MTFREYLGQDAQNPPATDGWEELGAEDHKRLHTYLTNGQLGAQDAVDIKKMMSTGFRFDDALSRALEQANRRKYLSTRQPSTIIK
jgi:hypothetical protein